MTFVVNGNDRVLDQVRKQLEKIVTVVKVLDFSATGLRRARPDADESQHARTAAARRSRRSDRDLPGRIVDVSPQHVMVEISGRENKIEAFIEQMRPFGILEMVRTGRIAMLRDDAFTVDGAGERPAAQQPESRRSPESA